MGNRVFLGFTTISKHAEGCQNNNIRMIVIGDKKDLDIGYDGVYI